MNHDNQILTFTDILLLDPTKKWGFSLLRNHRQSVEVGEKGGAKETRCDLAQVSSLQIIYAIS